MLLTMRLVVLTFLTQLLVMVMTGKTTCFPGTAQKTHLTVAFHPSDLKRGRESCMVGWKGAVNGTFGETKRTSSMFGVL